jgi:glutamine amidotransferase
MIGIIDYGMGNVQAFSRVYKLLEMPHVLIDSPAKLNNKISKIILPGVGSFDHAMSSLNASNIRNKLDEYVLTRNIPTLGVCVGFQIFCRDSDEGEAKGLGWIEATVKKLNKGNLDRKMPLPHMGWNTINVERDDKIIEGIDFKKGFYYLHSYHVASDPNYIIASSEYGEKINAIFRYKNLIGIQPHPEKSHSNGIKFLENFGKL